MNFVRKVFNYLINRYTKVQLLVILVIIVFAFLISDNSIFTRLSYDAKIIQLSNQIDYYRQKTVEDKQKLKELNSDKDQIEKFAREKYLMKKSDEDIFIEK